MLLNRPLARPPAVRLVRTGACRAGTLARRTWRGVLARARVARFTSRVPIVPAPDVITLGDMSYGGYQIPAGLLTENSVVLSAGAGTDVSFESMLVDRFGCRVHLLDPVPAAAEHARAALAHEPRVTFEQAALWDVDTTLTFHAPVVDGFVSHSATDMHGTAAAFVSPARSVASLRAEHGWGHIDLLKISAEGSEFHIIDSVLDKAEPVTALCVEFAQPVGIAQVEEAVRKLEAAGYTAVARSLRPMGWKMTFLGHGSGT